MNKTMIDRECFRANKARKVCAGNVDSATFFRKIKGDLLVTGKYACKTEFIENMVHESLTQSELPVVILNSRKELSKMIENMGEVQTFNEEHKNYHPLWGLDTQAMLKIIRLAAESWGCHGMMDQVLLYAMALLEIVNTKYVLSLPAIAQLLRESDHVITNLAIHSGLPKVLADNIAGNQEAGILVRRIVGNLIRIFENVAVEDSESEHNMLMAAWEIPTKLMFYQYSVNQQLMNACLKEELHMVVQKVRKLRVIAIEPLFKEKNDELLEFLMEMKRIGKIELFFCSENVGTILKKENMNFTNVCMFLHDSVLAMETISENVFGNYLFHYPVKTVGKPPSLFFTLKRDEHWGIATEKRLCIRAIDLYDSTGIFHREPEKMAIKIGQKSDRYIVSLEEFFMKKRLNGYRRIELKGGIS